MDERALCTLCRRPAGERGESFLTHSFCPACVQALGEFAARGAARGLIWESLASGGDPGSTGRDGQRRSLDPVHDDAAALGSIGETLAQFNRALKGLVAPEDAAAHVELASAYAAMRLSGEAIEAAATALQLEQHLSREAAEVALAILLDPRGMRHGLDDSLDLLRGLLAVG